MTDEVYDNLHEKHVNFQFLEEIIRLNEEFDDHADKLNAMIAIAQTHDNFNDQSKLTFHSFFSLLEDEVKHLSMVKNKLFEYLHP